MNRLRKAGERSRIALMQTSLQGVTYAAPPEQPGIGADALNRRLALVPEAKGRLAADEVVHAMTVTPA